MDDEMPRDLLIIIDTETTGIPQKHGPDVRPVQIGAVALDRKTGNEVSHFIQLLCPDVWVDGYLGAQKIHGISRPKCEAKGLGMTAGWERFTAWLGQVGSGYLYKGGAHRLSAWSVDFDRTILFYWQKAAQPARNLTNDPWPTWKEGIYTAENGCAQALYRDWCRQSGRDVPTRGSLQSALTAFGLPPQPEPHDALADSRAAADVWRAIRAYPSPSRA